MATIWAFIFVCILSLMFLGMLYGDKLSVVGLLEGRWTRPITEVPGLLWEELCRAVDLTVLFVTEHFSWVLATTSGSIGLSIVAFLMFSGVADDAAAVNRDLNTPLHYGGVLDTIPDIRPFSSAPDVVPQLKFDGDSRVVQQDPLNGYMVFNKPDLDLPTTELPDWPAIDEPPIGNFPTLDGPLMGIAFRRIASGASVPGDEPTPTIGRLMESSPVPRIINDALRRLPRFENWQMTMSNRDLDPMFDDRTAVLEEATEYDLRDLEARIRVIPGGAIAEQDLRIEKISPPESGGNEVPVEIALLNVGSETVYGVMVREYLPRGTQVKSADREALLRDDVLTWVIQELPPYEEKLLKFTAVAPVGRGNLSRRSRFVSVTEVSSLAAVTAVTEVREEFPVPRPRIPELPADNMDDLDRPLPERPTTSRPGLVAAADVRMSITEPVTPVEVGSIVEVMFELTNQGNGSARNLEIRVNLDPGMRHVKTDGSLVTSEVAELRPGATRRIPLRFRLAGPGEYRPSAELFVDGKSIDWNRFRIVGEDQIDPFPTEIR